MISYFSRAVATTAFARSALALAVPQIDGASLNLPESITWPESAGLHARGPAAACDYSKSFDNLAALDAYVSPAKALGEIVHSLQMPIQCSSFHALKTLINMMDKANANYTNVNAGYDDLFKIYKDYMYDSTPAIIDGLMFKKDESLGNTYFRDGPGMKYFDCTVDGKTAACPDRKNLHGKAGSVPELKLRDANGFNAELTKLGVAVDWLSYGDHQVRDVTHERGMTGVFTIKFKSFPIRNDKMIVPNPKDVVTPALKGFSDLRKDMQTTLDEIQAGKWTDPAAPAIVYSVPVFVLIQGIDNMAQAKTAAEGIKKAEEKEAEERKKNIILLVLSLVFMFVPVVGPELASAAGLATLARSLVIIGELGNGALAIYDTVKNPESAIVNVLGSLFGLAGLAKVTRTEAGLGHLADIRAGMKPETISSFGPVFADNNKRLTSILKCL